MNTPIYYLAGPYTHPSPAVMDYRFQALTKVAGVLFSRGLPVFSPITHSHPIKLSAGLTSAFDVWMEYDFATIERLCRGMYVLKLDGWMASVGVTAELKFAHRLTSYPIEFLEPGDFDVPAFSGIADALLQQRQ